MRRALRQIAIAAMVFSLCGATAPARSFHFIAYGDTGYRLPRDTARAAGLIDAINREEPSFALHVGDFKGYTSCSDAAFLAQREMFSRHRHPLILTPGDNDWADCGGEEAGGFDPLERLSSLRRIFFSDAHPLGSGPLGVTRQSSELPENLRWTQEGVVFATVHAIGPHNGLIRDNRRSAEATDRSTAGEEWVRSAFRAARDSSAPALVLAFQADIWTQSAPTYEGGPFDWLRNAIRDEAANYQGQVLVVHGDSHRLVVDTPFRRADIDAATTTGMNVTRLQVPGWPDHRAVRIDVAPGRPGIFRFSILMARDEAFGARP